jgi:hypothetical protein
MGRFEKPLRRLKVGERVLENGAVYKVAAVNEARAKLVLESTPRKRLREFDDADGKHVAFEDAVDPRLLSVSPCAFFERAS